MTRLNKVILTSLAVVAAGFALFVYVSRNAAAPATPDESLEELRSLPYIQFENRTTDQKKKGVTSFQRDRAYEGCNLISNYVDEIYLMDMDGNHVHTWRFPKGLLLDDAVVLEDGSIVASAVKEFLKLDWDSKVLWRSRVESHHEVTLLPDGSFLTVIRDQRKYRSYDVNFDGIANVGGSGEVLFAWKAFEHLDEIRKFHPESLIEKLAVTSDDHYDYYHINTIKILPANVNEKSDKRFQSGNLLTCFRNVNLIAILDKDTKQIVWNWGPGVVDWPHAPTFLQNGHILIFDNGFHRGYTRVIEMDPVIGKIVWEYKGDPPKSFFSDYRGGAQRLPNGNTLICEGAAGHVFEVDSRGQIVWEYWNPEIRRGKRQGLSFFERLSPDILTHLPLK